MSLLFIYIYAKTDIVDTKTFDVPNVIIIEKRFSLGTFHFRQFKIIEIFFSGFLTSLRV